MRTLALAMRVSLVADLLRGEPILPEQSSKNTNSPHEASEDSTAWGKSGYRLSIATGAPIRDTKTKRHVFCHFSSAERRYGSGSLTDSRGSAEVCPASTNAVGR